MKLHKIHTFFGDILEIESSNDLDSIKNKIQEKYKYPADKIHIVQHDSNFIMIQESNKEVLEVQNEMNVGSKMLISDETKNNVLKYLTGTDFDEEVFYKLVGKDAFDKLEHDEFVKIMLEVLKK